MSDAAERCGIFKTALVDALVRRASNKKLESTSMPVAVVLKESIDDHNELAPCVGRGTGGIH